MLNMQFDQRVVINTTELDWKPSPLAGVWRKPLERNAAESGHTTSLVRFESGSSFACHRHPLGEEILVLEGVFSDEKGDYSAGTYLRNPPDSEHTPFTQQGCILLVKLDQFAAGDKAQVRIDSTQSDWAAGQGGLQVMPLHDFAEEHTALVKWPAGEKFQPHKHFGGEEIFVISGELKDEHGVYPAGSWIRSPHMSEHCPYVEQDTLIWVKVGHLVR